MRILLATIVCIFFLSLSAFSWDWPWINKDREVMQNFMKITELSNEFSQILSSSGAFSILPPEKASKLRQLSKEMLSLAQKIDLEVFRKGAPELCSVFEQYFLPGAKLREEAFEANDFVKLNQAYSLLNKYFTESNKIIIQKRHE